MRICMVVSVPLPPGEGIGYYTWNLSRYLIREGHEVQIITRGARDTARYEVFGGIPVWRPPFYPVYPFHVHLHRIFVQRLVRQLEDRIDVFHLHTPLAPALHTKRPVLLTVHSTMLMDMRAHRIESMPDALAKLQAPVSNLIERSLIRVSSKVTAVSESSAQDLRRRLVPKNKGVEVMWNGVDLSSFSPDAGSAPEPESLLFVGRLAPGKGLTDLVKAMALVVRCCPGARLLVAGSGPLQKRLQSLITHMGLERQVILLGQISSRERLRDLYRKAWTLVLPSHHESMPTVVLEAMACGTPVISTRVGDVANIIDHGVNGLLVKPRAPEEMAHAICNLLQNAELRARLGCAAYSTVKARFSWQAIGANYVRCYHMLLNGDH